tara:strand:- start:450 stop:1988 length:1539 start_codon:yes stop_codon:yes gene_type:complete
MKPKILTYMSGEKGHVFFGVLKALKEKIDFESDIIIDRNSNVKEFFLSQKFVDFKKLFFYRDHIFPEKSADLEYLEDFEKRTKINLLIAAFADPSLFRQDNYPIQQNSIILSLLSDTCKLFEKIMIEEKPDFLMIHWGGSIQINLLESIAKFYGVKVLKLNLGHFGPRWQITQNFELLDDYKNKKSTSILKLTDSYLHEQQEKIAAKHYFKTATKGPELKKSNLIKNLFYNFNELQQEFNSSPGNYQKKYSDFLFELFKENISRHFRKKFLDKNALKKIDSSKKFVYFPLHVQPESTIDYSAPFFTKQISVIRNISQSLPINYELYVKEHFSMGIWNNWRPISYYKEIQEMPNVQLIHPSISSSVLLENCKLVTTIHGSVSYESLFYKKPVILFTEMTTSKIIPSVIQLKELEELPSVIRKALNSSLDDGYIEYFESKMQQTFNFDISIFADVFRLFYKFSMIDDISNKSMEEFLEKRHDTLEFLAKKFMDKIDDFKQGKILTERLNFENNV